MTGTLNKATLIGFLGRDPEGRSTQSGERVVRLSLATSESWRDKSSGERRERVEWHHVAIFNPRIAEIALKYLHKGSKVYVEGSLHTYKQTDSKGLEHRDAEIILGRFEGQLLMLDSAASGASDDPDEERC
jgi:single-strand DNA-binding protein